MDAGEGNRLVPLPAGKGRAGDCTGLELQVQVSNLVMWREAGECLPTVLYEEPLPTWSSVTSAPASPFCIPSSAVQTPVPNSTFYLLGSILFPAPHPSQLPFSSLSGWQLWLALLLILLT